jgi:PAS domain S-box-containing protein
MSTNPAAPKQYGIATEQEAVRLRAEVQAKLAAIIESSDDAIISKTLDGVIRTWNRGAERIFGFTSDEAVGQPMLIIIPPERHSEEPQILQRLRNGERIDHYETVRRRKDGTLIDVSVTVSPIRDSNGVIVGASKIARDITGQKRIQRELEAAKEAAETASRAKDHFLSILSHELRTPLTPALGGVGILEAREDLPDDVHEQLALIRRNIETQARLVDDLLDLTRISRGIIELHFETVDLHAALRGAVSVFQKELEAKELAVTMALNARESHVWADPDRIQQVFFNLLSNAIKFTPAGGSIMLRSRTDASGRLMLTITDTGIGIEPQTLSRLFQPFEQGQQSTTSRRYGGLGLGLSITRALLQMHQGTIRALSEGEGRGSTFEIMLPTIVANDRRSGDDHDTRADIKKMHLRVLLVEDHEDSRRVLGKLLEGFGCTVFSAGTVGEALLLAENRDFDLLVSDIGLPDGSGVDLMRAIRHGHQHQIKGIALSGFGQAEDLKRSEEAGFDVHLTKPVNLKALQEVIKKVVV